MSEKDLEGRVKGLEERMAFVESRIGGPSKGVKKGKPTQETKPAAQQETKAATSEPKPAEDVTKVPAEAQNAADVAKNETAAK